MIVTAHFYLQQVQRLLSLTGVGDRLTLVDAPEELLPEE